MSREDLEISDDARARQQKASKPNDWVWVTANAGSGKTHVLAERVIRLLLEGVEPSRILCLTYTKVAAAQMRSRVFQGLANFAIADDFRLKDELKKLGSTRNGAADLERARRLFAEALETPGGLKIQTIHAFCEMVLRRFPLEANIAGHFELLQGHAETVLIAEARMRLILKASDSNNHPELAAAFSHVFAVAGEDGLEKLVDAAINLRGELAGFIPRAIGTKRDWQPLYQSLGFAKETEVSIAQSMWPAGGMDDAGLRDMLDVGARSGAAHFNNLIAPYVGAALANSNPTEKADLLVKGFLKGNGTPYGESYAAPGAIKKLRPDFYERYVSAATHIQNVSLRLADFRLIRRSTSALLLAETLIAEYEAMKQQRGLLDFSDLISRTQRLLSRPEVSAWVRYKLDAGIDHVLLDEAQDTSPGQWHVLQALTTEIFDNREGSNRQRTVFVVGDPKQSIYSFQGARPDSFDQQRSNYERDAKRSRLELKSLQFLASFRSAPAILDGVDQVFAQDEVRKGVSFDGTGTVHQSLRPSAIGRIDVWDVVRATANEAPEEWTERQDVEQSPLVKVAKSVAKTIARWTATGFAKPGEILVLVRKRNAFIHALARELKNMGVAVGGVDRLTLLSHIAIKDLLALARVCVSRADSLSLASLLKSPVFGYSDDAIMTLALAANGKSLVEALAQQTDARSIAVFDQLKLWRNRADTMPLDQFFALALGADGLRRKFVARFGTEVEDILDAFLMVATEATREDNPGLDAFIEALEAAPPEIKRQMDQARDEVRIMTVHAAKGLEAKHVFLADGGGAIAHASQRPVLGLYTRADTPLSGNDCYLWTIGKDASALRKDIIERHELLAEDEYRRLLYVAMTRAENTLTICSWRSAREKDDGWAEWVKAGLFGVDGRANYTSPEGIAITRLAPQGAMAETGLIEVKDVSKSEAFVFDALPPEPAIPRPLAPSAAALIIEADAANDLEKLLEPQPFTSPVLGTADETPVAMQRGTLIHTLLQRLPDMADTDRADAAARFIARNAGSLSSTDQTRIIDEALAVVNKTAFAVLFAAGSKAEVQVSGTINLRGKSQIIAGKIDRISVTGNVVTLMDFKTGRVPNKLSDIPESHIVQLALYRMLVAPVFPDCEVRAALVYTSAAKLMVLEQNALQNALDKLGVKPA
jgi:ATP-dependent helicase/nuclease subunit A